MRTGRIVAPLALAAGLLAGCAQPGQLGSPPPPEPAPTAAPASGPPAGPVLLGSGRIADRVQVRTSGPAVYSVRTIVLPPGGTTGWHRHPGTEISIVTSGTVTLLRKDSCTPRRLVTGDAVVVPDAQPHLARNDGSAPAEVVVTYLLEPDAPERADVPPLC